MSADAKHDFKADFRTIAESVTAEIVEKKSRFIAQLRPVADEQQALDVIAAIRAAERGARHNPYAYRLHDGRTRYSDDGEPAQTAGRPMLDVLVHAELTDVVGVVTRYFGGILLGTGGLVRAYSGTLQKAVDEATILTIARCVDVQFVVPYGAFESVRRLVEANDDVRVLDTTYADAVTFQLRVREGRESALLTAVADTLSATPDASVSAPYDGMF